MLQNETDAPAQDWSGISIKIDKLHAKRDALLNDRKFEAAYAVHFEIFGMEMYLGDTILAEIGR